VLLLAPFPSRDAFRILEPNRVRYAVFHMNGYNTENRNDVLAQSRGVQSLPAPALHGRHHAALEIVGFPP